MSGWFGRRRKTGRDGREAAEILFRRAAARFNSGDSRGAIEPLRACLSLQPDHAEANFALAVALGRTGRLDEGGAHVAKAAWLGHRPAVDMLPRLGADYCRRCGAEARFAEDGASKEADIVIVTGPVGFTCGRCRTVLCGSCAFGGRSGPLTQECPDCGGALEPMVR